MTTNFGDVYVTAERTCVSLRMGHPLPDRTEAVITYGEARQLAEHLLRLAPAPSASVMPTDEGIFG